MTSESYRCLQLGIDAIEDAYDLHLVGSKHDPLYLQALRLTLDAALEARRIGKQL